MDSQSRNKTIQASFSFFVGILLFCTPLIFYYMFPMASATMFNAFLFLGLPLFSYAFTLGINSLVQFLSCNRVSIQQVALASLAPVGFVLAFGSAAHFFPLLQSPVLSAVSWVPDTTTQKAIALGFYLFWGGAYGEAIAAGLVTGCPK